MAKTVKPSKSGTRSIRGLIRKDLEKTIALAHPKGSRLSDHSIHDFRRNLKRLRANLRLIRDEVGAREFRRDNRVFRETARRLIDVRDATILVDALESLARHFHGQLRSPAIRSLKMKLLAERNAVKVRVLGDGGLDRELTAPLKATRKRIEKLAFGKKGWAVLGTGLRRTYKRARQAFRIALDTRTDEALHECRKHVKYLYFQLRTLNPIWPGVVRSLADEAKNLTDLLGDDHDLVLLERKIREHLDGPGSDQEFARLAALIGKRRRELQARALAIGDRLLLKKSGEFAAQLEEYWDAWKSEGKNLLH